MSAAWLNHFLVHQRTASVLGLTTSKNSGTWSKSWDRHFCHPSLSSCCPSTLVTSQTVSGQPLLFFLEWYRAKWKYQRLTYKKLNIANCNHCGADSQVNQMFTQGTAILQRGRGWYSSSNMIFICRHMSVRTLNLILYYLCDWYYVGLEIIKGQSVVLNLIKCKNFSYSSVKKY